jgi:hypothetical protein
LFQQLVGPPVDHVKRDLQRDNLISWPAVTGAIKLLWEGDCRATNLSIHVRHDWLGPGADDLAFDFSTRLITPPAHQDVVGGKLALPALPRGPLAQPFPISLVDAFELQEDLVITGVVAPTALKICMVRPPPGVKGSLGCG